MSQSKIGRLLISFIVIGGAVSVGVAQQVQSVKSSQTIQCGERVCQLRLLTAEAVVNNKLARSLAIVLTPNDDSESRVFGIYWIGATSPLPTHRDDTTGNLGNSLINYGDGKVNGEPVVKAFFSEANCASDDPQVIGVQTVTATQGLLDNSRVSVITLSDVATQLNNLGVNVDAAQVEDSSPGNLEFFKNIEKNIGFSKAIRNYVSSLLAAEGRIDQVGNTPSLADEAESLRAKNTDLENKVRKLETEKASFLGTTPIWLSMVMLVLSLGGITFLGLVVDHVIQGRSKKQSWLTKWLLARTDSEASSKLDQKLEKELKELRELASGDGDGSNGASVATEIAPAIQNITDTLQNLTTDVGAIKKNVEGFHGKLDVRMKTNQALQNIWHRLYTSDYTVEQTDQLVKDVCLVIELHNWLRSQCVSGDASISQGAERVRDVATKLKFIRRIHFADFLGEQTLLTDIAESINIRLADDARRLKELSTIENAVRKYTGKDTDTTEVVTKLIEEHIRVQQKLEQYEYPRDLNRAIDAVFNVHQKVTDELRRALPNQEGKMGELVTSLVAEYLKAKPEAERAQGLEVEKSNLRNKLDQAQAELEAGKQLADEIALEFNLNPDRLKGNAQAIAATLKRLKEERESSVYLQLRLGLSSALIAFEKTANTTGSAEQNEVLEALNLQKVKDGIRTLLTQMEECTGEQLWHRALSEGFSEKWLHYLIRADLLLRTYYADRKEFAWLSKVVSFACSAILAALYEFQVEVVEVELLGERPKEIDTESVYSGIRNLQAVRDKVRGKLMNGQTQELVVDVTSFPYFVKGIQENRGRAALANPSAWVQH